MKALLDGADVRIVQGRGRLDGPGAVIVEQQDGNELRLQAPRVILATGSTCTELPTCPWTASAC